MLAKAVSRADCSGVSGTRRRRTQARVPARRDWTCAGRVDHPDHHLVERTGLDQPKAPVRTGEDESRVVDPGTADDRMAEPDEEGFIGREEDIPGLRDVEVRRTAETIVQAVGRLIDMGLRQGGPGQ